MEKSDQPHPKLHVATVTEVGSNVPKYNSQNPALNFGQQEMIIDYIEAKDGEQSFRFPQVPPSLGVYPYPKENTVICSSRESVAQEIVTLKGDKQRIVDEYETAKADVTVLDEMLETLNPQYKGEKERERDIAALKAHAKATDEKLDEILKAVHNLSTQRT